MNKYEMMFIVRPDMEEAEIRKTAENMKKVLTDANAKVLEEKGIFDLMNKLKHNEKAFKIMESVFLN